MSDRSIDPQSRAIIRYALRRMIPGLQDSRQADASGTIDLSEMPLSGEDSIEDKINMLTEKICGDGEEPAAALLVLMSTVENATHPKALANIAKHLAFTRCGELNVYGMVDAQIAALEDKLLATVQ